jgi:hypothetical protein
METVEQAANTCLTPLLLNLSRKVVCADPYKILPEAGSKTMASNQSERRRASNRVS